MSAIGYAFISLLLLLVQTSLMPQFFLTAPFDLLLVQVVYTSLNLSPISGAVVVLFSGVLADGLSGTPFGLYTTSYLWLFMVLQVAVQVVHVHSRSLIYLAILAGTVLENLVAFLCLSVGNDTSFVVGWGLFHGGRQLIWSAILGPLIYGGLSMVYSLGAQGGRMAVTRLKGGDGV